MIELLMQKRYTNIYPVKIITINSYTKQIKYTTSTYKHIEIIIIYIHISIYRAAIINLFQKKLDLVGFIKKENYLYKVLLNQIHKRKSPFNFSRNANYI